MSTAKYKLFYTFVTLILLISLLIMSDKIMSGSDLDRKFQKEYRCLMDELTKLISSRGLWPLEADNYNVKKPLYKYTYYLYSNGNLVIYFLSLCMSFLFLHIQFDFDRKSFVG